MKSWLPPGGRLKSAGRSRTGPSTSFARQFVHRAGSCQPSKEAHDKNRGNDRSPPCLQAERCEGSRPERCDGKHDGARPRYRTDQAQTGKSDWRNTRVRTRDWNRDSQSRQKTQRKDELRGMLAHARLNYLSPARDLREAIQPLPCTSPREVEEKLVAGPPANRSRYQNTDRAEPSQVHHHDSAGIDNVSLHC